MPPAAARQGVDTLARNFAELRAATELAEREAPAA
jgi:hypothetical protein